MEIWAERGMGEKMQGWCARGLLRTRVWLEQVRNGAQGEMWPMSSWGQSTLDIESFHADGHGATGECWGVTASALCPRHCSPSPLPNRSEGGRGRHSRAPGATRRDLEVPLSSAWSIPKFQESSPAIRCPGAGFPQAPW